MWFLRSQGQENVKLDISLSSSLLPPHPTPVTPFQSLSLLSLFTLSLFSHPLPFSLFIFLILYFLFGYLFIFLSCYIFSFFYCHSFFLSLTLFALYTYMLKISTLTRTLHRSREILTATSAALLASRSLILQVISSVTSCPSQLISHNTRPLLRHRTIACCSALNTDRPFGGPVHALSRVSGYR